MKESYIFLADGFEEVEALTPIDVLRRAGMPVKTVSISHSRQVTGAHGVIVTADLVYDPVIFTNPEWFILPGGMPGATNLYDFAPLGGLLKRHHEQGGKIAAICASPVVVLGQLGILNGENATCYPGFEQFAHGANMIDSPVVISHNLVTGNGPANALVWSLAIVGKEMGESDARAVATGMLLYEKPLSDIDFTFG